MIAVIVYKLLCAVICGQNLKLSIMKIFFLHIILITIGCNSPDINSETDENLSVNQKIVVSEVIHTSNYTYLQATQDGIEKWFALPLFDAKKGESYYYSASMEMVNFASRELNRTFDKIYFLEGISLQPIVKGEDQIHQREHEPEEDHQHLSPQALHGNKTGAGAISEKKEVKIDAVNNGITIAELFSHKEKYEGKIIRINGEVVKLSSGIMGKNWIHVQDGTEHGGKFDLTITSVHKVTIGDVAIFEGTISINKDLGFGYFFEVLMEDAVLKSPK